MLKIFESGTHTAEKNMDIDAGLLRSVDPKGGPLLRLYDWKGDSATYGYFVRPDKYLDLKKAEARGLRLARRPTGGGIVFHTWDLAFSFLLGSEHPLFSTHTLDNYAFVNRIVLEAVKGFLKTRGKPELISESVHTPDPVNHHFCMARPTRYDVILGNRKIAGAAQRRTKLGYLHQGTISLAAPQESLLKDVLLFPEIYSSMIRYTFAPLGEGWTKTELSDAREEMKIELKEAFRTAIG